MNFVSWVGNSAPNDVTTSLLNFDVGFLLLTLRISFSRHDLTSARYMTTHWPIRTVRNTTITLHLHKYTIYDFTLTNGVLKSSFDRQDLSFSDLRFEEQIETNRGALTNDEQKEYRCSFDYEQRFTVTDAWGRVRKKRKKKENKIFFRVQIHVRFGL